MSRDKDVINENGEIVYRRLSGTLGSLKRFEEAITKEVIWKHPAKFPSPDKREFINPRTVTRVLLIQDHGFHQTWYRFTYSGNNYIWKSVSSLHTELKCYHEDSGILVAEFNDRIGKPSSINIYPLSGWVDGFQEFLIFSGIDVGETIIDCYGTTGY
ncbi:hypothetical protein H4R33_004321 [Dimargaris cristalligena]|nr:hypothetical protein H4R33_004321 [Dimargaris cristalligena]